MAELRPCPFCGGTDIFVEPDERGSGGQHVAPYHVGCIRCKCEQCADEEAEAIAAWNRRVSPGAAQTREVPPGWKLVPVEPTEDMILEGNKRTWPIPSKYAYHAMLAAAPASQPVDGVQGGA